jgi:hypothetical protein
MESGYALRSNRFMSVVFAIMCECYLSSYVLKVVEIQYKYCLRINFITTL